MTDNNKTVYYDHYREYFEYNSEDHSYEYHFQLENYNDNKDWPLDNCLHCKCDLYENEPIENTVEIGSVESSFLKGIIVSVIVIMIAGAFIKSAPDLNEIAPVALIVLSIVIFAFLMRGSYKSQIIKLYYCPECNSLLHNETPEIFHSKDPPKVIFKKLEQIPGFKLK